MDETSKNIIAEIEAALDQDPKKIGEVWRAQRADDDVVHIQNEMGWETPSAVYSYRTYINVLRGEVPPPPSPTMALQCSRQIASFIQRHPEIAATTKERLEATRVSCFSNASNDEVDDTTTLEDDGLAGMGAGVYVYTLPHYIQHPVIAKPDASSTPRTLLKVGKSDIDIEVRIKQQTTTALPEPPMKLRVYLGDSEPAAIERNMHAMLDAADHNPNRAKGAGKEWFLTNLKFLDAIAKVLDLQTHRYNGDKTTELET